MEAKLITGDEPIVTEQNKWDFVATLSDKVWNLATDIDMLILAAEHMGENTADLRTLHHLAHKLREHYHERANALIPNEVTEGIEDEDDE